jgi:hypothetical protein
MLILLPEDLAMTNSLDMSDALAFSWNSLVLELSFIVLQMSYIPGLKLDLDHVVTQIYFTSQMLCLSTILF